MLICLCCRRRRGAIGAAAEDDSSESGKASADIKGNGGATAQNVSPVEEKAL